MKYLTKLKKEYEEKINNIFLLKDYDKSSQIKESKDVLNYVEDFRDLDKEVFVCFYLNTKNRIIKREVLSIGTLNSALIHPREVFRSAVLFASSKIIICHNHPSGDPKPSDEDIDLTERMKQAGEILGIKMIDHIIVTKKRHWSYVVNGK